MTTKMIRKAYRTMPLGLTDAERMDWLTTNYLDLATDLHARTLTQICRSAAMYPRCFMQLWSRMYFAVARG